VRQDPLHRVVDLFHRRRRASLTASRRRLYLRSLRCEQLEARILLALLLTSYRRATAVCISGLARILQSCDYFLTSRSVPDRLLGVLTGNRG
jgi:hypothetical protein